MVSADANKRWAQVIAKLKSELDEQRFNMWFSKLKLYDASDSKLTILADTQFAVTSLRNRYGKMIDGAIMAFFGRTMDIEYILPNQVPERQQAIEATSLNPRYTFDTFIVGGSNSYAHAAAFAVAEQPGEVYNPLFIYGGVGLGKTHLLNAIGNEILSTYPEKKILFMTSEGFANELIDALVKKKGTAQIRAKMRGVDVLLVDDIQFLGKTTASQEEFFHTFNDLYGANKAIVLASDRPPKEIPALEERLRSRFEGGLLMDIGTPDFETRLAILKKKMENYDVDVPEDVLSYIAERVNTNIREMEGVLQNLTSRAQIARHPVTMEMAVAELDKRVPKRDPKRITPEMIVEIVSAEFGVSVEEIFSSKRNRPIAEARQYAIYLTRELTNMSTLQLGKAFGRDHSTVMHSCEKVEDAIALSHELARHLEQLKERIKNQ